MIRPLIIMLCACAVLAPVAIPAAAETVPEPSSDWPWVAVHRETGLWSGKNQRGELFGLVRPGAYFQVAEAQKSKRLYVWDPVLKNYAWIDAQDVGPAAPPRSDEELQRAELIPEPDFIWTGTARVSMYTCVELGGCNRTASGIWPYEGVVAVDPRLIPLGSNVWLDGLGTFLAADTGSLVKGPHIDVYVNDYGRARAWGIRYLKAAAFRP